MKKNKRYFKDFYGGTASIAETPKGFRLRCANAHSGRTVNKVYETYRGARTAMGRMSDGWREVAPAY